MQLVQEPSGRLERIVEAHIGCGVLAWVKFMFTTDCSREALLFIYRSFRFDKLWQKRYVLYPRLVHVVDPLPTEKMRRHDMHSRHVFAYEFIYYRATVIFENRFVVPSAFGRQYIACLS